VAGRSKFNRIPKTEDLIPQLREAGLGLHVLPTFLCVLDHCDNRTGTAWMSINRIAKILGVCRRTVERHMNDLCSAGLVLRNHQQRGRRGRFSTRRYVVPAVLFFRKSTVRHQGRTSSRPSIYKGTKSLLNSSKQAFNTKTGPEDEEARRRSIERKQRKEGYEWLFG
jgi:hypothetical protein